jgi:hypothetical protein
MKVKRRLRWRWLLPGIIIITVLFTTYLLHNTTNYNENSHRSNSDSNNSNNAVIKAMNFNTSRNENSTVNRRNITTTTTANTFNDVNNVNKVISIKKERKIILLTPYVKSVTSDVHGNLGDPNVVLSESVENWLTDRWQAASNMQGSPIPGTHYLHLFLNAKAIINHVIIDFETAYSDHYKLLGCITADNCIILATSANRKVVETSKNHIIHRIELSNETPFISVKLIIEKTSTQWGTSVWRLQLHGYLAVE